MEYPEVLFDQEGPARRISSEINAIGVMAMGLAQAKDPYAEGFCAVWDYLDDADRDFQKRVKACLLACLEGDR